MTTFAYEVYAHQKRNDGTYNIKIRITHNRKKKYISTPFFCDKTDLTKSLKIKNQHYIDECQKIITDYRHKLERFGMALKSFDIDKVYEILTRNDEVCLDLQSFFNSIKDGLGSKAVVIQTAINSLLSYTGRVKIDINDITVRMLNGWIENIQEHNKASTAISYIAHIRNIVNRAKRIYNDEDAGEVLIPRSPFEHINRPKMVEPRKRAITIEQLRMLVSLPYRKRKYKHYFNQFNFGKDIFMLSFYLIGCNLADFYDMKKDCYKNGRITYNRVKTRNRRADNAEISIYVCDNAKPILEKYLDRSNSPYLFIFRSHYLDKCSFNTCVNLGLKQIGKIIGVDCLQFYSARHTWATIAVNEAGVDKYSVHLALNHANREMAITDVYIKKDWSVIDRANNAVLEYCQLPIYNTKEE